MNTFDPATFIDAAEAAGAQLTVLIHDDGSAALSTWVLGVDWDKMPSLGDVTGERLEAVTEELWRQGKATYAGPAPRHV